jgi:hypothetical protein
MSKLSHRGARVKAAVELAYGTRGLTKAAAAVGVSKQLLAFIVAGDREVTDDVYSRVADALRTEAGRMTKAAGKIEAMASAMAAELKE